MATAIAPLQGVTNNVLRPRDEGQPATVKEFLNKLCKDFDRNYAPARLARYYQWARMECYYRGQQLIWYNPESRQLEYLNEDETELYFINNIILPFIEMISAEYTKSRPRFASFSETGASPRIRGAMDNADYLMGSWSDTLWTPEELQRESKLVQFRSRLYTLTEWDDNAGVWLDLPQFGEQQADFGEGIQGAYQAATGKQRKKSGGIVSKAVDPFKVKVWDRRYTPEESPYIEYEDFELDALLRKQYAHLPKLPKKTPPDPMSGLAFLRQLETAIGNTGEADAQSGIAALYSAYYGDTSQQIDDLTSIHTRTWFETYMYEEFVTGGQPDDVFGDGSLVIPPQTKLIDVFPDGIKWCRVNGEAVAAYNEAKNDKWSGYLFMVTPASHYGVGAENLMAQQEWFTEIGSLIVSSAMYGSNGITVADASKIKNGKVLNRPGTIVELEDMVPGVDRLDDVIKHLTTTGVDPVLMQMPQFLKESVQLTSGARNSQVSGLPGQGLQTATGVQNMTATADSAAAMKLELRAQNLARRMEQGLKIWQQKQQYPRYFGRFTESTGRMLRGLDIPYELRVRFEPDSHEPRTNFDKKQDFAALIGLLAQVPEAPPPIAKAAIRLFAPDLDLDEADSWSLIGQKRVDAMDEVEEKAKGLMQQQGLDEQMASPFVLQEMLRVAAPDQLLDNHQALGAFYREYYLSDEYLNSSEVKKEAIHQLVMAHEAGGVMEAQKEVAQQVAAQAPAQQAQMEQQAQQKQIDGAGEGEETARQEANESEARQADEERGGIEREHQAGEAEKQRLHDREMQSEKHAHEQEMAKIKAKESKSE